MAFGSPLFGTARRRGTALRRRRAVLVLCCAALAAGSTNIPASAAPPPLPPRLVEALQRDLGIDADEYARRVDTAHRLSDYAKIARIAHPAAFAGVRMDGGRGIVSLTDEVSAVPARATAEAAGFTVETVAASEATLRDRRAGFERWLAGQPGAVGESIFGYGIDSARNELVVRVAEGTQLPIEAGLVRAMASAMPQASPDSAAEDVQSIAAGEPAEPVVGGGQAYAFEVDGEIHRCSFGFNATDAAGSALNITAGHCDPENVVARSKRTGEPGRIFTVRGTSDKRYVPGEKARLGDEFGHFEVSSFAPHDYGILRLDDAVAPRFRNNLVSTGQLSPPTPSFVPPFLDTGSGNSGSASENPGEAGGVLRITGTTDPVAGAVVCKAGFRSGYSCGVILASDQVARVKGKPGQTDAPVQLDNMFITTLCGHPGDSGGPIMAGTEAVGITSSILSNTTPLDGTCGHVPVLFGQPIGPVLRDHPGVKVRTS